MFDIHNIKHPALKSIILAKLVTFTELGITCQFECRKPLDNIYIDTFDFIRVVGILLDNAQEYVTTIEEKHIEIYDVNFNVSWVDDTKIYTNIYTIDLPKGLTYADVIEDLSVSNNVTKLRLINV